jgi:uncharacterized protein YegL
MNDDEAYEDEFQDYELTPGPRVVRFPVVMLLDVSGSMVKSGSLAALNAAVKEFFELVHADLRAEAATDLALVAFAGAAKVVLDFTNPIPAEPPTLAHLQGDLPEGTDLAEAVGTGLAQLDRRTAAYREAGANAHKPLLVLMTDALPQSRKLAAAFTAKQAAAADRCRDAAEKRDLHLAAVGVGAQADLKALAAFTASFRPPRRVEEARLGEFLGSLSRSLVAVSRHGVKDGGPLDDALAPFPNL